MDNNLRVTLNELEISPGKRARYSGNNFAKRSKFSQENIQENNFMKASKQVLQIEQLDTLKRLKLLYSPKCSICMDSSTKLNRITMPPLVVTMFVNEMQLNTWYDALEICYYWITPTQYLPENVLRSIVEIMLNAHNDITTQYSIDHIIHKCQQILAYNFNMHPPCKAHIDINRYYIDFLTNSMDDNIQKYSNRKDFGHKNGIVKYCFNRLEDEILNKSTDRPLHSEDYKEMQYRYSDGRKETLHRLHWEQQNFEIYEMLDRSERINRLMAVLQSVIELIQMDMYISVGAGVRKTFLQMLCGKETKLKMQIIKLFAYSIHLDFPDNHTYILSQWLNTLVQMIYFNSDRAYTLSSPDITKFENEFYKIISGLQHKSIVKILERIEPPCIKYLVCRRYCYNILSVSDHSVISIIINFINCKQWLKFPKSNEYFIPNTITKEIQQTDILNHLSYICKSISHMSTKTGGDPKTSQNYESDKITQCEVIQVLYISLEALLEAFYVKDIYNILNQNNVDNDLTLQVSSKDAIELETQYREIYQYQQILIGLMQSEELPKCLECFKIILN